MFHQEHNTPDSAAASTPARKASSGTAATTTSTANTPPDARELLKLPYISHLRPSTLLGYLVSCAPPQLPSPFDTDIAAYVDMLTDVFLSQRTQTPSSNSAASNAVGGVRALYVANPDQWRLVANEAQSWSLTQQALDTFFQRVSVASGDQKVKMRLWYETIMEVGSRTF